MEKSKSPRLKKGSRTHLKNSSQKAGLLFLIEHKSFKTTEAMLQLLNYQTGIYNKTKVPTVPVLVYHGQAKWTGPLTWQEHLKGFSDERLKQAEEQKCHQF